MCYNIFDGGRLGLQTSKSEMVYFLFYYDGHNLSTDYKTLQTVDPTETNTMKLSGQSGPVKTTVANEVIADMILTNAYQ